jgi:hypothetical protein
MRYGPSGVFANVSSALLVADFVLIHATIQRSLSVFWGFPLSVQISSAGTAGLIGAALLAPSVDQARLRRALWIVVAALSWVAAAVISDWAETDGIFGARALPQWWYAIHKDSSGASGVTFFSGQAVAGAVAGFGVALPIVFDRTRTFRRRTVHALVVTVVAALTWTAIFHGRWVACGFGIGAPEAGVEIPPPAA